MSLELTVLISLIAGVTLLALWRHASTPQQIGVSLPATPDVKLEPTTLESHQDIDLGYYERVQQEFESLGFRFIGDLLMTIECADIFAAEMAVRVLSNPTGDVLVDIWHARGLLPSGKNEEYVGLFTTWDDGTLVSTDNSADWPIPLPPQFVRLPADTSATDLIQEHREGVEAIAAAKSDGPRVATSIREAADLYQTAWEHTARDVFG